MPQVYQKRHWKRFIMPLLALAIIAGIMVAVVWRLRSQQDAQDQAKQAAAVLKEAQTLDNSHKYTFETQVLENYVNTNPPKQYQYQPLLQLGVLALNHQDYAGALKWYKRAEAVSGKVQLLDAAGAGEAEAVLGNKQAAISYYQQAANLANTSDPNETNFKAEIKALESAP